MPKLLEQFCRDHQLIDPEYDFQDVIKFIITQPVLQSALRRRDLDDDMIKHNPESIKAIVKEAIGTYTWISHLSAY